MRLYTFKEASERTGMGVDTLRLWRRQGKLVCIRVGGGTRCLRIPAIEIERLTSQIELGPRGQKQKVG